MDYQEPMDWESPYTQVGMGFGGDIYNQVGTGFESGLLVYRPSMRRQHGHGLGAFFGRMFRALIPIAKNVLLPHAANAVKNVASDFLEGKDVKQSIKSNAVGVLKGVGNDIINQTGNGRRRRSKPAKTKKSTTKKAKTSTNKKTTAKSRKKSAPKRKQAKKNDFIRLFD